MPAMTISQQRVTYTDVTLNDDEVKNVVEEYLQNIVGEGCYITHEGLIEHWTNFPHGSGTTTDKGKPTALQQTAWKLLTIMREVL